MKALQAYVEGSIPFTCSTLSPRKGALSVEQIQDRTLDVSLQEKKRVRIRVYAESDTRKTAVKDAAGAAKQACSLTAGYSLHLLHRSDSRGHLRSPLSGLCFSGLPDRDRSCNSDQGASLAKE